MFNKNYKRYLPHFNQQGAIYFVTFSTKARYYLEPFARTIVLNSFHKYEESRYKLCQCIVMPDHGHALLQPTGSCPLSKIMKLVKGYAAFEINRLLGREGSLWEQESFDRIIRNEYELEDTILYIRNNAVEAGLTDSLEKYPWYYENLEGL